MPFIWFCRVDWTLFVVHLYQCQKRPRIASRDSNSKPRPLLFPSWYHLSKLLKWYQDGNNKGLGLEFESWENHSIALALIQMRPQDLNSRHGYTCTTLLSVLTSRPSFWCSSHRSIVHWHIIFFFLIYIYPSLPIKKTKIACKHIRGTTFLNMVLS